jgi:ribosomal protein L16 Arg81 hydroxylase
MATVLPESLRACWAAWRRTPLLHRAAVPDEVAEVAVVEEVVAGGVLVVTGAAVVAGAPADGSSSEEEPHPAASMAISTVTTSRPMVRHIWHPLCARFDRVIISHRAEQAIR